MSKLKTLLVPLFLVFAATSTLALAPLETIVEAGFSDVRFPAHEVDDVRIRRCSEREVLYLSAAADTEYRLGGFDAPRVSLQEFRAAARKTRNKSDLVVYVGYIEETQQVTRIVISAGAQ